MTNVAWFAVAGASVVEGLEGLGAVLGVELGVERRVVNKLVVEVVLGVAKKVVR